MSTVVLWSALAGAAAGAGVLLLLAGLPVLNRPGLAARVRPYAAPAGWGASADALRAAPAASASQIIAPMIHAAGRLLRQIGLVPSTEVISERLRQANLRLTPNEFRLQQLNWAAAGALLGAVLNAAAFLTGRFHPLAAVLIIGTCAVLGAAARNQRLAARITVRNRRMLAEFPAIAELLALAVSAGETAPGAFQRISRSCRGELADDIDELMTRVRAGLPFSTALRGLSREATVPAVARFLDGVLVAVERGTPLADVMHAQAADARDITKRELMEAAGRKEVAMLAPVIFGILPLTIIFAAFPGLALLQIGL